MNSISNTIEIINFDELNRDEQSIDLEQEIGINYMDNFINEKYESEYSEGNSAYNSFESSCNLSVCTELNANFSLQKLNLNDSYNISNFTDQTAYSENKRTSPLFDSFINLEKVSNNSFSYLKKPKFRLSIENDLNLSHISHTTTAKKFFPCTYDKCEKIYKSKENLTLHYKNIHLREKPYSCKFCNSRFSHRNGKTYHERKFHTKYLPHKCSFEDCTHSFASKSALSYHLKSQHGNNRNKKHNRIHKSKFNEKIMEIVSYYSENHN